MILLVQAELCPSRQRKVGQSAVLHDKTPFNIEVPLPFVTDFSTSEESKNGGYETYYPDESHFIRVYHIPRKRPV